VSWFFSANKEEAMWQLFSAVFGTVSAEDVRRDMERIARRQVDRRDRPRNERRPLMNRSRSAVRPDNNRGKAR
jgi:hypothetical protein